MVGDLTRPSDSNSTRFRATYFNKVIAAYAECREYPPVVAITYDDEIAPNRRLTPQVIEYLVDIDNATHRALDRAGLYSAWLQIVAGETVPMAARAKVTDRCARLYISRKLQPFDYFRNVTARRAA